MTLSLLCQIVDVRRAHERNVPQEMVKMGPTGLARRQPLASKETAGHLQLAPPSILPIPLAGDGPTTTQRGFAISRRQFQEISLAVRPCAGLRCVLPALVPILFDRSRIAAGWGNVLQEHFMDGYLAYVSKRSLASSSFTAHPLVDPCMSSGSYSIITLGTLGHYHIHTGGPTSFHHVFPCLP